MKLFIALVLSASFVLVGCSAQNHKQGQYVTWEDVIEPDFLNHVQGVAYMSSSLSDEGRGRGFVAFIDAKGGAEFLQTDALESGKVSINRRHEVSFATETTSYVIAGSDSARRNRGGTQATAQWAGSQADGTFVQVFNSGYGEQGYETDVFWGRGKSTKHSVVPDVPGAVGMFEDDLLTMNAGSSTTDGSVTLYSTDLDTERTSKRFTWRYWQDKSRSGGVAGNEFSAASNLYAHDGKVWFLEEMRALDRSQTATTFPDGSQAQLRLGEIDLTSNTYRSTKLGSLPAGMAYTKGGFSAVGAGAFSGYERDGKLHTVDADGNLLSIDLDAKGVTTTGRVSEAAMKAASVLIAWRGDTMSILLFSRSRASAVWETYSLSTGEKIRSVEVQDIAERATNALHPASFALMP